MAQLKSISKKLLLVIVTISLVLTFIATPSAEAKLTLGEGEFYYSGTTKGTYKASTSIFSWLLTNIGDIADWLIGIMTMGFRMVFVGWTALIEKILTWTLEGTTGVNTDGENVSSTDLSSVSDSSNNITVQAIVYNQVPAFDINFFNLEYDKSYSGTGKKLTCSKCDKPVKECCGENATACSTCENGCKGNCDDCQRYIAANSVTGDPIIVQIKKVVATWYYVMRLLSAAVLLIILIGIGIKMGLSTIASEKAVYKRMLIDWVAGAVLVFAIHYIMIFVIFINTALVNTVKESANSINKVQMMQMAEKSDSNIEYTDEELEINIYEAVRTRAYDPKLMNGMSGMIMYMTLVYFAIRYSIVYLKRLLTLIVLTLMAPAVGVSYAIQKVFSGKAQSLTNWGTEYTMNVLIQTVHAIIYSVFISTALILSLQNVAGMILALILMNFALKAEKTFRTIFKMGAGGSLLDHTAGAGDAEKMKETFNSAKGLAMGAKPALKALSNTPYAKALKGAAKLGVASGIVGAKIGVDTGKGIVDAGKNLVNKIRGKNDDEGDVENTPVSPTPNADAYIASSSSTNAESSGSGDFGGVKPDNTKTLINAGGNKLLAEVQAAAAAIDAERSVGKAPSPESTERLNKALANYSKYKGLEAGFSTGDIVKGHAQKLIDVKNNYMLEYNDKGNVTLPSIYRSIFGTKHRDTKTGKMVSDKNGLYTRLSSENLLGFTPEDKKLFKQEVIKPILAGAGGIASVFVGMGTMVAHPKMGLAMVAGGKAAARGALKKPISAGDYKGTYAFGRFAAPTVANIQKETLKRSKAEWNRAVVSNIKNSHPEMYNDLVNSTRTGALKAENFVKDLAGGSGAAIGAGLLSLGVLPVVGIPTVMAAAGIGGTGARKFMARTGFSSRMDKINAHSAKQLHQQQLQFIEDGYKLQGAAKAAEYEANYEAFRSKVEADEYAVAGLVYDERKKEWIPIEETETTFKKEDFTYPPRGSGERNKVSNKDFTSIRVELEKTVEQLLEEIPIADLTDNKKYINSNGEEKTALEEFNEKFTKALIKKNVIKEGQTADVLFADGIDGMIETVSREIHGQRSRRELAEESLVGMTEENKALLKSVMSDIAENGLGASHLKDRYVINKMNQKGSKAADPSKDGSITITDDDKKAIQRYIEIMQSPVSSISRKTVVEERKRTEWDVVDGKLVESTSDKKEDVRKRELEIDRRKAIAAKRVKSKLDKIDEMVNGLSTDTETLTTLAEAVKKGTSAKVEVAAKSDSKSRAERKKKLDEIMKIDLSKLEAEEAQKKIEEARQIVDDTTTIEISNSNATDVLELLLMRKELERVNELAVEELKLKTGTPKFAEATKGESKAKVQNYKAQLDYEQEKYNRELNGQFDHDNDQKMQLLEIQMQTAEQLLDLAIEEKAAKGPIISVDAFVEDIARTHGGEMAKNMRKAFENKRASKTQRITMLSDEADRKQRKVKALQEAEESSKAKKAQAKRESDEATKKTLEQLNEQKNNPNNKN